MAKNGRQNGEKPAKNWRGKDIKILGIDPGLEGAFVLFDGGQFESWFMPVQVMGKKKEIYFDGVHELLSDIQDEHGGTQIHIFVERAMPLAMGAKHAFNYGRGFAALEIAIELLGIQVTYVEPQKWAKEMHQGISGDLKPKARSMVALKRLFPKLMKGLPTNTKGRILEGPMDALLIAAYGHRRLYGAREGIPDFF